MALIRVALLLMLCPLAVADDRRAEVNYMLHCQGCHLPGGEGFEGRVPKMQGFVGYFLHSDEGRQFLVRVPGVAQSALRDPELAELLNWLVTTFSPDQLPESFAPFSADEVGVLRQRPEHDPAEARTRIIADLAETVPGLAMESPTGGR